MNKLPFVIAVILFIAFICFKKWIETQITKDKLAKWNQEQLLKLLKEQEELIVEQGSDTDMEKLIELNHCMEHICTGLFPPEKWHEKNRTKLFREEYGSRAIFKSTKENFSKTLTQQSRESIQELIIAIANHDETKANPELLNALSTLIQASKHLK